MAFYTSHIYAEANEELISFLKSDPSISMGLYHLRHLPSTITNSATQNEYPQNGVIVVREVCDPNKAQDDHDEARVHQRNNEPIISWWELTGSQDLQVIYPLSIPTLAFGQIYINNEHNPPPPLEFLRFLKGLSLTYNMSVAFYHKYSAYEDELAMAEYAWVFGKQDSVYIRHVDGTDNITQYMFGVAPKVIINSERDGYSQPILHLVMKEFGATIKRFDDKRQYFHKFNWNEYQL